MTEDKFINIHTHTHCADDATCIINLFAHQPVAELINNRLFYSIGLHPLHIDDDTIKHFEKTITDSLVHPNIIAIGETGIDRRYDCPVETQQHVFEKHVEISERYKKPVIIHCVRSFNDLITVRNKTGAKMPWILHAYYGNKQITEQLLKFNCYFSFGKNIMNPTEKLVETIGIIPVERIFAENDEDDLEMDNIYDHLALIKNISLRRLKDTIQNNFETCFGNYYEQ